MPPRSERLRELFQAEARERLAQLTAGALQVERGESTPELVGALFRSAHTIKGGARMLGLDGPAAAAEPLETLLADLRARPTEPATEQGGALLGLIDALREAIWPPEAAPTAGPAAPGAVAAGVAGPASGARLRVAAERVDAVIALVSEARRVASRPGPDGAGARATGDVLAAAEEAALRLRLAPLSGLFGDLARAVRDAAHDDGKLAELVATGGEVEADAAVVDAAAEIVLQLVRNAVAHGIEPPATRRAAGKPATGRVRVEARARGGWLELGVEDDGRGVDAAGLARRAAERGQSPETPTAELLFAPGLSTRARADALGGRGVGLDVVRARALAAGGGVAVTWRPGLGTRFTVRLPVAALYERLLIGPLAGQLVGLPADAVAAVAAAEPDDRGGDRPAELDLEGLPEEVSVLTVPLGPLFAPGRLARRAWIAPDGRVGVVLEAEELLGRAVD